ncbi:hypothetical protein CDAR_275981 [Caerostris darwini]|uniref:Uncharacterized protein n=1 Tax=Caerostris darwini TaxID=1538125 RepID=A0AAV4QP48_9ARAC|nr:hypothetical protein CDAR_275981 [Caerostris darwini]
MKKKSRQNSKAICYQDIKSFIAFRYLQQKEIFAEVFLRTKKKSPFPPRIQFSIKSPKRTIKSQTSSSLQRWKDVDSEFVSKSLINDMYLKKNFHAYTLGGGTGDYYRN